jgi:signal transduction histidine kinase
VEIDMKLILRASAVCLIVATLAALTSAQARSLCDGDFERMAGGWVATTRCQEYEAARVAREMHQHLTDRDSSPRDVTPEEFCRGNNDIRVSTFCGSYKD